MQLFTLKFCIFLDSYNSNWDIFLSLIFRRCNYLGVHLRGIYPVPGEHKFQVKRVKFRPLISESFWAFSTATNFISKAEKTLEQIGLWVSQSLNPLV